MDADESNVLRLVDAAGTSLAWSPDSSTLLFSKDWVGPTAQPLGS